MSLPVACNNTEMITVICTPLTGPVSGFPGGKPAELDGPLRVSVQSGDGTFSQDPLFPLQFKAISGELLADTVYLVEGDADLLSGASEVELIQDTVVLTVTGARARFLGLAPGIIEPKPAATTTPPAAVAPAA